ncbi:MAG TPA: hypothetical protein VNQ56_00655 [Pseudolabrys sp.]|nr:hypothetical protein [Pseudolabrys sp.]
MPRYFFHTQIGDDVIRDTAGAVLRDPDHAWRVAQAMIAGLLEDGGDDRSLLAALLVVTDEAGETVFELPFSEALIPPPGGSDDEPPPVLQ